VSEVFVANDHVMGVAIPNRIRRRLLEHCRRAGVLETGGILIGHYSDLRDQAVITEVTGPPRDSVARRFSFVRGLIGLQARIDRAWRRGEYYLGEWHFHPFTSPDPSPRDLAQIIAFSKTEAYCCPEPILVVVGDDPNSVGRISVWLVVNGKTQELTPRIRGQSHYGRGPRPGPRDDGPAEDDSHEERKRWSAPTPRSDSDR
jgi:integrative and conjugative element protein (TIGR02256 family)